MQIFTKLSNKFKYSKSRKLQASAQTRLTAKTIYAVPGNSVIIDASLADKLTLYWGELSHCATPGSATSTAAHSHKTHGRWTPSDSAIMKDLRVNRRSFLFSTLSFVKRPSSANRQRANRSAAEAIAASLAVAENRSYSGAPSNSPGLATMPISASWRRSSQQSPDLAFTHTYNAPCGMSVQYPYARRALTSMPRRSW